MIGRIVPVLLCLLFMLPVPAAGEDTATLDIAGLMARQVSGNSSLLFRISAELSDQPPFFLEADQWQSFRTATENTLEGSYIFSRAGETLGNSQLTFSLMRDENALSVLHLNGRDGEWQIWGDPMGDRLVILPRDTSVLLRDRYLTLAGWGAVLLRGAGFAQAEWDPPAEGQWPALWRLITRAATQDAEWQERFEAALTPLTDQISAWMQGHTAVTLRKNEDGSIGTASLLRADGEELRREILDLFRTFYSDRTLMNLLRPLMTRQEAESYLEPGMVLLYEDVLGRMSLPDTFSLERLYDGEGNMTLSTLVMPLADGTCITWKTDGTTASLRAEKEGKALEISWPENADGTVEGTFALQTPEGSWSGRYQLILSMGAVYEDEDALGRKRRQQGEMSLVIVPDEGQSFPAQTLTVSVEGSSGLATDQPARVYVVLDWQELGGGAGARLVLQTRTAAAIRQTEAVGERTVPETREDRERILSQMLASLRDTILNAPQ